MSQPTSKLLALLSLATSLAAPTPVESLDDVPPVVSARQALAGSALGESHASSDHNDGSPSRTVNQDRAFAGGLMADGNNYWLGTLRGMRASGELDKQANGPIDQHKVVGIPPRAADGSYFWLNTLRGMHPSGGLAKQATEPSTIDQHKVVGIPPRAADGSYFWLNTLTGMHPSGGLAKQATEPSTIDQHKVVGIPPRAADGSYFWLNTLTGMHPSGGLAKQATAPSTIDQHKVVHTQAPGPSTIARNQVLGIITQATDGRHFWLNALQDMHNSSGREAGTVHAAPPPRSLPHAEALAADRGVQTPEPTPAPDSRYPAQPDCPLWDGGCRLRRLATSKQMDHAEEVERAEVHYLEFFGDTAAMERKVTDLAVQQHAAILRSSPNVFGKTIRRYLSEQAMPPASVLATCHYPTTCSSNSSETPGSDNKCDPAFQDPNSYTHVQRTVDEGGGPAAETAQPLPICHSPPTTSRMVYTLVELEDRSLEHLMWACHTHNLRSEMCHVTELVVVIPDGFKAEADRSSCGRQDMLSDGRIYGHGFKRRSELTAFITRPE
eukprot:CAMPEP_0115847096 /NCGR_PEP_ID=MMETSP0287-20121206/10203_1 /TAXON_ID=412157 /ORGANISM="Chrysochromulina rotalis, Strain UIO044" /LENGTH=551 /DNA_ID=CAMNT_0003300913 /DNA_START=88 /DNA_END=1744 /DNA_ORIENTATION=+